MITFTKCDQGVTEQFKQQIKTIITENLVKIYDATFCSEVQDAIHKLNGQVWNVMILKSIEDFDFFTHNRDKLGLLAEVNDLRIILHQSFYQGHRVDAQMMNQKIEEISNHFITTQEYLKQEILETVQKLKQMIEQSLGEGFNILAFISNQNTSFEYKTAYSQLESELDLPIDDEHQFVVFIYYTALQEEQDIQYIERYEEEAYIIQQQQQQQIQQPSDEYEEPMKLVFKVFEGEQHFKQSSDQLKISFDSLEINPLKLQSFTLIYQMMVSPFPKEIKDDLNIISTGSSLMSKNITIGINKDQLLFLNFITNQGKMETLYSQMKLKRNQLYQVVLSYTHAEFYKELSLFVNGIVENQVSLSQGIDVPRGIFWIGSEQALKLFKGMIKDVVFIATNLGLKEVKSLYAEIQSNQSQQFDHQRLSADIIEEILIQKQDEEQQQQSQATIVKQEQSSVTIKHSLTSKKAKKNQIPVHLQKTHFSGFLQEEEQHKRKQQEEKAITQENEIQIKSINELGGQLNGFLIDNEVLLNKCRELSMHFCWVFQTASLLAPPFEEGGQAKLPFDYIHQEITKEKFDTFPVYAIELERFAKMINYADIQLSKEEILDIAHVTESLRKHKDYGYYILYDRFLLATREASLSREEIEMVRGMYSNDEKEEDQDLLLVSNGIHRQENEPKANFSFFEQLSKLVGGDHEAFKFRLSFLVAYYIHLDKNQNKFPNVQKLTAVYIHKETEQEVEVEGIEFFNMEDDKIFSQKMDISDEKGLKYFRVHYGQQMNQIAMVSFKTHQSEETFLLDQTFQYQEGQDATNFLQTYPIEEGGRLSGFRGTLAFDKDNSKQLIMLHAEYLIKDPEVVRQKQSQPEQLPQVPENWNGGRFHIVINRCSNCTTHNTTTWHEEYDFATKFNELGQMLKDLFPNIEIFGNWDHTYQLEHFEVYIRGVGPQPRRDRQGRIFLFKKNEKLKSFIDNFPKRMLKVYDEIILIAQAYGDTNEMEKVQEHFMKTATSTFPPRWKLSHDFPTNVPDKVEPKEKKEDTGGISGADYICKRWGCGQPFKYESNPTGRKSCKHHPGRYEFGSKHGLWPECWTCCGRPWEQEGCRYDYHQGVPEKNYYLLCLNRGEVDPKLGYPSSACGTMFQESEGGECKYHQGYLVRDTYNCCNQSKGSDGCISTSHRAAKWPDPQAKLYFVQKPLWVTSNPAQRDQVPLMQFKDLAVRADFYRETIPYREFINRDRERQLKLQQTENEVRYCLHWACEKEYKEIENRKKKSCISHPGVFDFGHTGIRLTYLNQQATTVTEAVSEYNRNDKDSKILWRPHWTCCRKPWNEPGCTRTQHSGPLLTDYKVKYNESKYNILQPKQFKWPSEDAQIYFKKKVSRLWMNMLQTYHYIAPEQASAFYDLQVKNIGGGGGISTYKLPQLCDKFKLHLWVCSEDLSYQFKFQEVINGNAEKYLEGSGGNIDKKKFLDWWFADVNQIKVMVKMIK